jgi:plastocyanin
VDIRKIAFGTLIAAGFAAGCSTSSTTGMDTTTGSGAGSTTAGGSSGGSSTGSSSGGSTGGVTYTVTITSFAFSPDPITVPAGATITVINSDNTTHSATSETAAGEYINAAATPGGWSFDTNVPAGGSGTISVPASITSGTNQPYYCTYHLSHMQNPNPVIHIQ